MSDLITSLVQSGKINLGPHARIEQAGDIVAGDKITYIVYNGPDQPIDAAARRDLEQAYRSEVALRYAIWRTRYATLPMQTQAQPAANDPGPPFLEPEDFVFQTLSARLQPAQQPVQSDGAEEASPIIETFTDLREGLRRYDDLLLLAPPGGGKTTALWRLALDLARDGLEDPTRPLPVFVRLGGLSKGDSLESLLYREFARATLYDTRKRPVVLPAHRRLATLLPDLLTHGRVVLLWDGLNEAPSDLFAATASAIAQFRDRYPPTIAARNTSITTCRAEDFAALCEAQGGENPLPVQQVTLLGLDSATTEALALGRLGAERGRELLTQLAQPQHQGLRSLVRTPLLLTMLCEVFSGERRIPPNRGKLLEAFVQTRWDWERQRQPDRWIARTRQQKILAALAYAMTAGFGRGTSVAWDWARQVIRQTDDIVEPLELRQLTQAADLLEVIDEGQSIRFSHQLLQEYFAALALEQELKFLEQPHLQATLRWQQQQSRWQQKLARYVAPGKRTGWEETLFLLAGLRENATYLHEVTAQLLSRPLEVAQLLHDDDNDATLREEIRQAALRQISDPALTFEQRLDAGTALGLIGDPRVPVTVDEWRGELARRNQRFGDPAGYFCYVRPGTYGIGAWEDDAPGAAITLHGFWIARFPITVAQFAPFVAEGYGPQAEQWWTPAGWEWKQQRKRTQPWRWNESDFNTPNQPVIGVTWYEARAYCTWLSARLAGVLPDDLVLRLPTEAEWEVAAAYDREGQRRPFPWGEAPPNLERAIYAESKLNSPTLVGCCPAGAAACGALDLAGNVWEVTTSSYRAYPAQSDQGKEHFTTDERDVPWRGGSWYTSETYARCWARVWGYLDLGYVNGLRVVLAPRLAHLS